MAGHKLEIDRAAGAGSVFVETDDMESVDSTKDGQHAASITVRWRAQYQEAGFEWDKGTKSMRLRLLPRQVRAAVEQLRDAQVGFCNGDRDAGCFDYGKVERPPTSCLRCLLLEACRRSGKGDLRRASPVPVYGPGSGLLLAFCLLMVVWVWTLNRWSAAEVELQSLRETHSPLTRR